MLQGKQQPCLEEALGAGSPCVDDPLRDPLTVELAVGHSNSQHATLDQSCHQVEAAKGHVLLPHLCELLDQVLHTRTHRISSLHTYRALPGAQQQTGNNGKRRACCAHSPPAGSALHPNTHSKGKTHGRVSSSLQNRQLLTCAGEIMRAPRVPTVMELLLFQTGMPLLVVQ